MAKTVRKSRIRSRNQNRRSRRNQVRKNKTKKGGGEIFGNPLPPPSSSPSSSLLSKLPPGIASQGTLDTIRRVAAENPNALAALKGKLSDLAPHVQNLAQTASPMAKQLANTAIQKIPMTPVQRYAAEAAVNAATKLGPAAAGLALRNPEKAFDLGTKAFGVANRLGVKVL
jgi:hypothetical protein